MSVKIRLAKVGKKHQISYRIVVQDSHAKRDGRFLEILGYYNPQKKEEFKIKNNSVTFWVQKGAKPTGAVAKILNSFPKNAQELTSPVPRSVKIGLPKTKALG